MSTYASSRPEARGRIFAAVAAIVVTVNVATGGEAIDARAAQASALVDAARAAIAPRSAAPEVIVETTDPAVTPRCLPKIRVPAHPGTRVVIRRCALRGGASSPAD